MCDRSGIRFCKISALWIIINAKTHSANREQYRIHTPRAGADVRIDPLPMPIQPTWEHFTHGADIGVRGTGATLAVAFEQTARALTAVITNPESVHPAQAVSITCEAPDREMLLLDWLNAIIYAMAVRHMLFSGFDVDTDGRRLTAIARGEAIDIHRHQPAVEAKAATFTELKVAQDSNGRWLAQCVVDV